MSSDHEKPVNQAGSYPLLSGSPMTPGMQNQYRAGEGPKKLWPFMVVVAVVVVAVATFILVTS